MSFDSRVTVTVSLDGASVGKQSFGIPLMLVKPKTGTTDFVITGVSTGTKTFTVAGDHVADFAVDSSFRVYASTGNDGVYTVHSATLDITHTDIVVHETIPSATVDGGICNAFGGDLYREYGDAAEVTADTAQFANTTDAAFINTAFSQSPHPKKIAVGLWGASFASPYAALAKIFEQYSDFYGLTLGPGWVDTDNVSASSPDATSAAAWAEANDRLFVGQTSHADCPGVSYSAPGTESMARAKARSLLRSTIWYHPTDTEPLAWGLLCNRCAYSPDVTATTWSYATVSGVTEQTYTTTQQSKMDGKNGNYYTTFYGVACSGKGKLGRGTFIDLLITADWTSARIKEAIAEAFVRMSNLGTKYPYDDNGFAAVAGLAENVLKRGEAIKHYQEGGTGVFYNSYADTPEADIADRIFRFKFGGRPAGAIEEADITGYVSISFQPPAES
jgi:hypothetical protein